MGKTIKKTYAEAYKDFYLSGYELLDSEYTNYEFKMKCIDAYGYLYSLSYSDIARKCNYNKFHKSNKYTIENIKHFINLNLKNVEIVEGQEWVSAHVKLTFNCLIHNDTFNCSWSNFKQGKGCPICGMEARIEKLSFDDECWVSKIAVIHPDIKILEINKEGRVGRRVLVSLSKCLKCGHIWKSQIGNLMSGCGCFVCSLDNRSGENHPLWNPNLTQEDRIVSRQYPEYCQFTKDCLRLSNWTCDITGKRGSELVVHHLNGYHWYKRGRTDVNNAVVICKELHSEFHLKKNYGNKNNTEDQYYKFKATKLKQLEKQ